MALKPCVSGLPARAGFDHAAESNVFDGPQNVEGLAKSSVVSVVSAVSDCSADDRDNKIEKVDGGYREFGLPTFSELAAGQCWTGRTKN